MIELFFLILKGIVIVIIAIITWLWFLSLSMLTESPALCPNGKDGFYFFWDGGRWWRKLLHSQILAPKIED